MPLPERKLIEHIARLAQPQARQSRPLIKGIGDDCAVLRLPRGRDLLVTTDLLLEGVHFRREWHSPQAAGHCCLARGLSDIAAMGGEPVSAFLSLALPRDIPEAWVDKFFRGFLALASDCGVSLGGGDLAQSPADVHGGGRILANITAVGIVPSGQAVLRSGARPGDKIYVTGELGGAAAVLAQLYGGRKPSPDNLRKHLLPEPRLKAGRVLRHYASAMVDLSDGLSTDLEHICQCSGVGAEIELARLPLAKLGRSLVGLEFALHGGDDYELLFTAPPSCRVPSQIGSLRISEIGCVTRQKGMFLIVKGKKKKLLQPRGWEHFRRPT